MVKRKKKLLPSSSIVTQSNELVSARYNLPLGEQRLLLTMIAKIQPDDEDFKSYRINISEFADFLGIAKGSAYHEVKKITEKLLGRVVKIEEPDGLLQIGWVSSAKYVDGTGMVYLSFDPLLKPYLIQLQGNFTSCKLEMLLSFKSQYTMRIYTLLKQYELIKEREIELDQLREMLGLRKDLHTEYRDFKRNILNPTQKELIEKADLTFEYDEIKFGRRVGAINFRIFAKKIKKLIDQPSADEQPSHNPESTPGTDLDFVAILLSLVPNQHKGKKGVHTAINAAEKKHGFDYVKRNILYSNAKAAKSYAGFIGNALKNDWGHDWALDQQQASDIVPNKPEAPTIQDPKPLSGIERAAAKSNAAAEMAHLQEMARLAGVPLEDLFPKKL